MWDITIIQTNTLSESDTKFMMRNRVQSNKELGVTGQIKMYRSNTSIQGWNVHTKYQQIAGISCVTAYC